MSRPIARLLLAAALALGAMSCGTETDDEAIEVTVIGDTAPALADPAAGPVGAPSEVMLVNVAQGLVRFDALGQIEPGLAERWNVSDDGLSYIFRLASVDWPSGRAVNARDVARNLKRQLRTSSNNPLRDTLGAVEDIVAMTDRVIEVRLRAPRPYLLQLLAQPEFAIVRSGHGTGPFQPDAEQDSPGAIALTRRIVILDEKDRIEHVHLRHSDAAAAIRRFREGKAALVLGGTFADLPLVPRDRRSRDALRFDPVAGLFGLVPARNSGPVEDKQIRSLLNRAIDREALIAGLNVPGLVPRTSVMQAGLEGRPAAAPAPWAAMPFPERRAQAIREGRIARGETEPVTIAIALPEGRGADFIFQRLKADWTPLGFDLVRAGEGVPADLKLVDAVAPSSSQAWFVRSFRCGRVPICSAEADTLMDQARETRSAVERLALLSQAGAVIDEDVLFLPLAAPVRWSLVGDGLPGFAENIFARHPLSGLRNSPTRERQ